MKTTIETGTPRDKQWLQECCELVRNKMPENYSFVIFGFPTRGSDRIYYASSAERDSVRIALKEWLLHQNKVDDWMKHDAGPPPERRLAVCSCCGRGSDDRNHISVPFWRCGAERPDGSKCRGVWIPPDAQSPNERAEPLRPEHL